MSNKRLQFFVETEDKTPNKPTILFGGTDMYNMLSIIIGICPPELQVGEIYKAPSVEVDTLDWTADEDTKRTLAYYMYMLSNITHSVILVPVTRELTAGIEDKEFLMHNTRMGFAHSVMTGVHELAPDVLDISDWWARHFLRSGVVDDERT